MNKAFSNFTWRNTPSTDTPVNQQNLNKINNALDTVDTRVVTMDTSKANVSDLLTDVVNVSYNVTTGVWTFTRRNGTTFTYDQNVEKIPVSFSMSPEGVITMTTADGTSYTADISTLIKIYSFVDSSTIDFTVNTDSSGNKSVTAGIIAGSITDSMLETNYLSNITAQAAAAAGSAGAASLDAQSAAADALLAESHNHGSTGTRSGEDTDNSYYYKQQSQVYSLVSEGYSKGTSNGTPVGSDSVYYHNNSKYFAEQAALKVEDAEAWSIGTRGGVPVPSTDPTYQNSAYWWALQAQSYVGAMGITDTEWAIIEDILT